MIFLNFSGIFEQQPELIGKTSANDENIFKDLKNMTGVNGYCSDEAAEELRTVIENTKMGDIHFLDNGNYHYISSFFLNMIREPFELAVFDHHTDMQPPGLIPCLSCGSWVLFAAEDAKAGRNRMRRILLIGPPKASTAEGVVLVSEEEAVFATDIPQMAEELFGDYDAGDPDNALPVYISVDKDVLTEEEVRLNWDQGAMSFDTLICWIEAIARKRRVIGLDICGEPLYNQFPDENVRISEKMNLRLFELARTILDQQNKKEISCRLTESQFPAL